MTREPRRIATRTASTIGIAVLIVAVVSFGRMWFQRPPFINNNANQSGDSAVVQLWGDCCQTEPEHVRAAHVESPISDEHLRLQVSFLEWLDGTRASVDGDTASFDYLVSRSSWPTDSRHDRQHRELHECTATDLRAGDTLTNGPVTIEVLAIHDMPLNRNNAIDLRITFDPDGIDDEPFDANC